MARGYVYEDDVTGWRQMLAADLPSSGVGAGTYGDATHVPQVTVDAHGLVTAAANVAISAGSGITALASPGGTIAVTNPTGPTADVDLPASGVAAGTYGDATDSPRFTVDAEGRVTAAANVPIGGISGTGLVLLFSSTLAAPAATIDTGAGGIAAGHGDLMLFALFRSTLAANNSDNVQMRVNADAGNNYWWSWVRNLTGAVSAPAGVPDSSAVIAQAAATSLAAAEAGYSSLRIPLYDKTTFNKGGDSAGGWYGVSAGNQYTNWWAGWRWLNTAAITRLAFTLASGSNFATGSAVEIYGTK